MAGLQRAQTGQWATMQATVQLFSHKQL
jgi:hypothetical protein